METKSRSNTSKEVIEQVNPADLEKIIAAGKTVIIDVRTAKGIESQGSIPGAINIPLEELKVQIDNRSKNPKSILNGSGPFLFCCTGGVMSYMAAIHAQENGIENVLNLEGGHNAWMNLKSGESQAA
ncbi:MAG: rhodanese-like domain-containing protein [Cyclobacteriaceae bacterium]